MSNVSGRRVSAPGMSVLFVGLTAGVAAAQPTNWTNLSGGLWSVNTNWDANAPINPTSNAFIDLIGTPYVVTLDGNFSIATFQMTAANATLDLTNNALTFSGNYLQQNAILRGTNGGTGQVTTGAGSAVTLRDTALIDVSNFSSLGTLTFDAAAAGSSVTRSAINHTGSAASWTGAANLTFGDSTTFTHGAASTFTISNDQSLVWDNTGTRPSFINSGVVTKSGGAGITFIDGVTFNNTGTLNVNSGTFRANEVANITGSTLTGGTFHVTNSTLDFVGASITTNSASVILDGATSTFAAINPIATNTSSGTLSLRNGRNFSTSAPAFTNNGVLEVGLGSTLTVPVGATFLDDNGTIGSPNAGPGGTLRLDGNATIRDTVFNRMLVQSRGNTILDGPTLCDACDTDIDHSGPGLMSWAGGGNIRLNGSSSISIGLGGTFNITNNQTILSDNLPGNLPVVINNGTFRKSAGAGLTFLDNVTFNNLGAGINPGVVDVQSGTLRLESVQNVSAGILTGGRWRIDGAASKLEFSTQSVTTNRADVILRGGSASLQFSSLQSTLTLNDTLGKLTLEASQTYNTAGNFTNLGLITVDGSAGASTFSVASGFSLSNYNPLNRKLTGGRIVVIGPGRESGSFEVDGLDIENLDADVELSGSGANLLNPTGGPDQDALGNLNLIDNQGKLRITENKNLATRGSFRVNSTGELHVGIDSEFEVLGSNALLLNINPAGVFDDGVFSATGRIIAPNMLVRAVNNDVTIDGPGNGRFFRREGEFLVNGFETLERIGDVGNPASLTLSGGQELDLLPSTGHNLALTNGSTLRIGTSQSPGGRLRVSRLAGDSSGNFLHAGLLQMLGAQLQIEGNWVQAPSAVANLIGSQVTVAGDFEQNGALTMQGSTIVSRELRINGLVSGSGQLTTTGGHISMLDGVISPGMSVGQIDINGVGDFQFFKGRLVHEIFGPGAGVGYDQIRILHSLIFLDVDPSNPDPKEVDVLLMNYIPELGETFDLVLFAEGRVGDFSAINLPQIPFGRSFERVNTPFALRLVVVPAPGSVLCLGGLGLMALRRRRA